MQDTPVDLLHHSPWIESSVVGVELEVELKAEVEVVVLSNRSGFSGLFSDSYD